MPRAASVHFPHHLTAWALRSVASSHTANYPGPRQTTSEPEISPCPNALDTYSSNTGQRTPLQPTTSDGDDCSLEINETTNLPDNIPSWGLVAVTVVPHLSVHGTLY
ncbi:hypothetical protein NQZ68_029528 [Dissostichus eleginoides]|nr:hypothetical protein NQZ68_029528 [Dissostichus eleginoides]